MKPYDFTVALNNSNSSNSSNTSNTSSSNTSNNESKLQHTPITNNCSILEPLPVGETGICIVDKVAPHETFGSNGQTREINEFLNELFQHPSSSSSSASPSIADNFDIDSIPLEISNEGADTWFQTEEDEAMEKLFSEVLQPFDSPPRRNDDWTHHAALSEDLFGSTHTISPNLDTQLLSATSMAASQRSNECPQMPPPSSVKFRKYQSDLWKMRYKELVEFHRRNHHTLVEPKDCKALSHWVKRQRYQYKQQLDGKHSTLTEERREKLECLGFVWDTHEVAWEHRFSDLLTFVREHGHTNVPTVFESNPSLGVWVKGQRRQYRLYHYGKKSTITQKRIDRLNSVSFQWMIRPPRQTMISHHFEPQGFSTEPSASFSTV